MRKFRLRYYLRESLKSFLRSGFMSVASVVVIAVTMATTGLYWLAWQNTQSFVRALGDKVEVVVYFEPGIPREVALDTVKRLQGLYGAEKVTFVSPEEAARELSQDHELARYFDLLEENPLPATARVRLQGENPELARAYANRARELAGVESVDYGERAAEQLLGILRALRWMLLAAGAALTLAALLMVSSVIRLTVHARREEISIMQLVGASRLFVKAPYVLEAGLQGMLGGLAASGLLWGGARVVDAALRRELNFDLSTYLSAGVDPPLLAALVGLGTLLGLLGSLSAVGKYME